jgi:hypothetical protein
MKLRFTIRDLLWLAALIAVCVAWWVDHHQANAYREKVQLVWSSIDFGENMRLPRIESVYENVIKDAEKRSLEATTPARATLPTSVSE